MNQMKITGRNRVPVNMVDGGAIILPSKKFVNFKFQMGLNFNRFFIDFYNNGDIHKAKSLSA